MATLTRHLTPIDLIRAIDRLSEAEKETLAILADKKLSAKILKRRKDALDEMRKGELISEKDIFAKS
ncbi:MAG: hypothetical protein AB1632_06925 [Nitrospirota bacterium]